MSGAAGELHVADADWLNDASSRIPIYAMIGN
jgi:hypothetical protein